MPVVTRDESDWPSEELVQLSNLKGCKALFDDYKRHTGTVSLGTADVHWWVFDDPRQKSKDMSSRGGQTGKAGVVFQDEAYIQVTPPAARRIKAAERIPRFGT